MLSLLYEIRAMRLIIETMRNMILPLMHLMGVLVVIFYIFSVIGMWMFGGKIRRDLASIIKDQAIPNNYYMDNFNDLASSFVTLFTLMVVNNWMVQVQMYVDTMQGNGWYKLYFVAFYYFSVLIGLNIVVAFTLDMYSSVERLDEERQHTLELVKKEIAEAEDAHDAPDSDSDEGRGPSKNEPGSPARTFTFARPPPAQAGRPSSIPDVAAALDTWQAPSTRRRPSISQRDATLKKIGEVEEEGSSAAPQLDAASMAFQDADGVSIQHRRSSESEEQARREGSKRPGQRRQ